MRNKDDWTKLEPNKKQGKYKWTSRGYKVRKITLNRICYNLLQDVGRIEPRIYNHIKWAMQQAIFDQEVLEALEEKEMDESE